MIHGPAFPVRVPAPLGVIALGHTTDSFPQWGQLPSHLLGYHSTSFLLSQLLSPDGRCRVASLSRGTGLHSVRAPGFLGCMLCAWPGVMA